MINNLYDDGIAAIPGAFSSGWGEALAEDFATLFAEASGRPDGTVNRGRNRYYFSVHPERLRGFPDVVGHPVLQEVSTEVLGPDWRVVEVAFDVPLPGSLHQPWHRDFETPAITADERRLTSLAFNITAVTVTPEMGPFEIAPGTQWDDGARFSHGMFPEPDQAARYGKVAVQKMPRLGDMSVRTGLAIHRGTPNRSSVPRPVLIIGVVGPEVSTGPHGLQISRAYAERLPAPLLARLDTEVVDELSPLVQGHDIEGLVMGDMGDMGGDD